MRNCRFFPFLVVYSLAAVAADPAPPVVQDLRHLPPAELRAGRVVLQGEVVHRAVDGSWIKVNVRSGWGTVVYLITRIDSDRGVLPAIPGTPAAPAGAFVTRDSGWDKIRCGGPGSLWLEGDIAAFPAVGPDWQGRFASGDQIARLQFQLLESRARGSEPPPTYRNISYGSNVRQVLDVYLAKSSHPTPVAVYVHGGAWTTGDKGGVAGYRAFLDAGISVVALNYRYCPPKNPDGATPAVALPLRDAARAIQFIRSKAEEWNLVRARLGVWGASAGACTALWLATHPDLAEPTSVDRVARESSRPYCVGAILAQTSLDPVEMRAWVGPGVTYGAHAFGIAQGRSEADFDRFLAARDRILPWIKDYSPAALLTRQASPIFLDYLDFSLTPCEPLGSYYTHSPRFGLGFYERAQQLHQECYLRFAGQEDSRYASWQTFMLAKLTE